MTYFYLKPEAIEKFCEEHTYNKYLKNNSTPQQAWLKFTYKNILKITKFKQTKITIPQTYKIEVLNNFIIHKILFLPTVYNFNTRLQTKKSLYQIYKCDTRKKLNKNLLKSLG